MCILFVYVADNPTPNSYKVIMAVNRDEMYKRPTKEATLWGSEPDIVGGRDMEPGREGGTWLAMSKTGRIAALLNVLQSKESLAQAGLKRGRGFLVNDFLKSSKSGMEYMNEIYQVSSEYNPFTLVTVDVSSQPAPEICYYSCSEQRTPVKLKSGTVYGIGNSFIETPFIKVSKGKEAFSKVVQENNDVTKKDILVQGILNIMKDQEKNHPDPQILKQAPDQPELFVNGISSRFITLPGYGTRTHTIILVDYNNKVSYRELTLAEPTNEKNMDWTDSTYEFPITDRQRSQQKI